MKSVTQARRTRQTRAAQNSVGLQLGPSVQITTASVVRDVSLLDPLESVILVLLIALVSSS